MRPLAYKDEYVDAIYDAIKRDVSLFKLANDWGVASGTFYNWSGRYPKFKVAMEAYRKVKLSEGTKRFFNRKQLSPSVKHAPCEGETGFVGCGFNSEASQLIIKYGFSGVKKWLIP